MCMHYVGSETLRINTQRINKWIARKSIWISQTMPRAPRVPTGEAAYGAGDEDSFHSSYSASSYTDESYTPDPVIPDQHEVKSGSAPMVAKLEFDATPQDKPKVIKVDEVDAKGLSEWKK